MATTPLRRAADIAGMPPLWLDGCAVQRWADKPVPQPKFAVADLVPSHCCTLLAGDGGSGKSILSQTMATCVATGRAFLGRAVNRAPALYLTAEDPDEILHSRQDRINKALGVTWSDLDNLFVQGMVDEEFILFSQGEATEALKRLAQSIAGYGVEFTAIDSASLTFNDSEIDRRAVSAFMRQLNHAARHTASAIVLIAHTSKTSDDSSARMASGSTAWVNGARAGLRLKSTDEGAELTLLKTNYSRGGLKVDLRWTDDGVLLEADAPGGTVAAIEHTNDDRLVLAEITARWDDPSAEPLTRTKHGGERYVPSFMSRKHGWAPRRAERAMVRLADLIVTARKRGGGIDAMGLRPCRG